MRNIIVVFIVLIGSVACTSTANSPTLSPASMNTSSPTEKTTATKQQIPTPTLPPTSPSVSAQDLAIIKGEIVDFMVDYVVTNEIEAMIDIINNEDIPLIENPPAQFIIILSPISQPIGGDYSKLMNALDTINAEQVWIYEDGDLLTPTGKQTAIQEYQEFIQNASEFASIFMWGYNEFGVVRISDDGQEAEVYLAASCGSLCGHGVVLLLVKNSENLWEIKDFIPIWGS